MGKQNRPSSSRKYGGAAQRKPLKGPEDIARANKVAPCERKVSQAIESQSDFKLRLLPKGTGATVGYIPNLDLKGQVKDLDFAVEFDGRTIAWIDVTCSNYTFEGSRIMPVTAYKGDIIKKLDVPVFIVFSMEKEPRPLKDRCVWIRGEDVVKSPREWRYLGGKQQYNHMTDKKDWHRGLQDLVKELLRIADNCSY